MKNIKNPSGFTLVEIMVTISIAALIMTVILFNYRAFGDNLSLSSALQEMSIAIRQAQVYGLSVKEFSSGTGQFNDGYGIYFTQNDPTHYYIFADLNSNNSYDGDTTCTKGSECIEKGEIRNNVRISDICDISSGIDVCFNGQNIQGLTAIFIRPKTDAHIYLTDKHDKVKSGPIDKGKVKFITQQGKIGFLTIESTGLVSIQ